jgi:hypothetical protein
MPAEMFGPYRLDELLGRGGMGEVWRTFDTVKERDVALKRLLAKFADDDEFRKRFDRGSKIVARLNEPHVIPIYDFGFFHGAVWARGRWWPPWARGTCEQPLAGENDLAFGTLDVCTKVGGRSSAGWRSTDGRG